MIIDLLSSRRSPLGLDGVGDGGKPELQAFAEKMSPGAQNKLIADMGKPGGKPTVVDVSVRYTVSMAVA